jgi:hypothetical protein
MQEVSGSIPLGSTNLSRFPRKFKNFSEIIPLDFCTGTQNWYTNGYGFSGS